MSFILGFITGLILMYLIAKKTIQYWYVDKDKHHAEILEERRRSKETIDT